MDCNYNTKRHKYVHVLTQGMLVYKAARVVVHTCAALILHQNKGLVGEPLSSLFSLIGSVLWLDQFSGLHLCCTVSNDHTEGIWCYSKQQIKETGKPRSK